MADKQLKRYARFEDWYDLDITVRGSARPIAKAAWEAGLAEGMARRPRLAPEHVEELRGVLRCHSGGGSCDCELCKAIRAALAALREG